MKLQEIRGKDSRQLQLDMHSLKKELFQLKFRGGSEQVTKPSRFREIRRTIARMHFVIGERARGAATVAASPAPEQAAGGKPAAAKPAASKVAASKQTGSKPAASKPAASKSAEAKSAEAKAAASKPAASKSTGSKTGKVKP